MANPLHSVNPTAHSGSVPMTQDYGKVHQDILAEWNRFMNGHGNINTDVVSRDILNSWERSRGMDLDPLIKPGPEILPDGELQDLLNRHRHFIDISRPFMNYLYSFIRGSGFSVSLFDERGFLLETIVKDEYRASIHRGNWVIGALWDEANIGTNIVGTILVLRKPMRIFGPQHYNQAYHRHVAFGAPIFSPDGKFMGGITVTGYYYWEAHPHTLGLTAASAKVIENELQTQKAMIEAQIASSYQNTVIASIPEALITIDMEGRISLLNENARKILRLNRAAVEGQSIKDVIGYGNGQFLKMIESFETTTDAEVRIFIDHSSSDFILTCNPIHSPDGIAIGKILILNEIHRAKTLVTNMIGAKANFQFKDIYGRNPKFLKTVEQARMVSQSTSNALLLGKSGTGKDIFAQAIHNAGSRRDGPYIAINCAAIPRDLITSELFGYSEGAFTGSRRGGNQGKFELADGGTIFLDEIAETPLELQAALLRVIEDKSVTRLGDKRIRSVDVRIIAATNKDLREEVRKGKFREDLYYRLNVFAIHLVPLNERLDDIPILTDCFIKKYRKILEKEIDGIDAGVMDALLGYPWPGNVRELQNVIERMMNFAQANEITTDLIPSEILEFQDKRIHSGLSERSGNRDGALSLNEVTERDKISTMLKMGVPKNRIAQKLNVSRITIYRKIKKYNLS